MTSRSTTPEMRQALERLTAAGIQYKQTSDYQIKVGPYNFYPGKGTIFIDRQTEARPERGLDNFIAIIRKLRERISPASLNDQNSTEKLSNAKNEFKVYL